MRSLRFLSLSVSLFAAGASLVIAADDPALDASIARAVLDYGQRTQAATKDLTAARAAVATERTPLMDAIRTTEEKIGVVEADTARLTTEQARSQEKLQGLKNEQISLERNLSYVANIVLEGFKSYEGNLLPGEAAALGTTASDLRNRVQTAGHPDDALAALDAADLFLARLQRQLGGYTAAGRSLRDGDNEIIDGTFAYLGPEVFFRAKSGALQGTVRDRKDSEFVVTYPLPEWDGAQAEALITGKASTTPTDVSGGRALRLRETRGSLWQEVQKAGVVGYVIMSLGAVALLITVMKLIDLRQLSVDSPLVAHDTINAVARGARTEAQASLPRLRKTTRELFATGLRYLDMPRTLLEEQLESLVLRHRLVQERRLQLLAVIATAGPLLGLLGTVTGMIKTFTLITVFGTGSAGRLSGGISEALVATALGLTVAIPTLVIHGFLSNRIHKGLALLERYALEFVTAAEEARATRTPEADAVA